MAAAAGDAGGPSASVGTSGSACARALVFPSEIGQFDVLLDCGADDPSFIVLTETKFRIMICVHPS
jgi:hypothetical protein